jgi:hypothetical protein
MSSDSGVSEEGASSRAATDAAAAQVVLRSNRRHFVVGIVLWAAVIAWIVHAFQMNDVDILLGIKSGTTLEVSGQVLEQGALVPAGKLHITVDNPRLAEHRESSVLDVVNGAFSTTYALKAVGDGSPEALRVKAEFVGKQDGGPIYGEAVAYTNCSSPIHFETILKSFVVLGALALFMIVLFTGDLTKQSAKLLFGATYLTCWLSVTAPPALLILVSENRYLMDVMRTSPVGLVKAKVQDIKHEQWFMNVGGIVREVDLAETAEGKEIQDDKPVTAPVGGASNTTPTDEPRTASSPDLTAIAPSEPSALPPGATKEPGPDGTNTGQAATPPAPIKDKEPGPPKPQPKRLTLEGGLAIPFYVIILALLGAGISMMMNVPSIQRDHIGMLPDGENQVRILVTMLVAPFARAATPQHNDHAGCSVRKKVIDQYMYLFSAPFLGIAVYYLLQIIATNVAEPVLVLMAFSAGLISESIVSKIIELAKQYLGQGVGASQSAPAQPVAGTRVVVAQSLRRFRMRGARGRSV